MEKSFSILEGFLPQTITSQTSCYLSIFRISNIALVTGMFGLKWDINFLTYFGLKWSIDKFHCLCLASLAYAAKRKWYSDGATKL